MAKEVSEEERKRIEDMIDSLVERAKKASEEYMKLDQEQVDRIVKKMSMAGLDNHMKLAKMAVEETGRGIYEDKITKNMFATEYVYHSIKYEKTVGIINQNDEEDYVRYLREPTINSQEFTNVKNFQDLLNTLFAKDNNAIIAMNAGGFYDPDWNSNGAIPHGTVISNGKIVSDYKDANMGGGFIGFDKDNKLVLGKFTKEEDELLKNAVKQYGEKNWKDIVSKTTGISIKL